MAGSVQNSIWDKFIFVRCASPTPRKALHGFLSTQLEWRDPLGPCVRRDSESRQACRLAFNGWNRTGTQHCWWPTKRGPDDSMDKRQVSEEGDLRLVASQPWEECHEDL